MITRHPFDIRIYLFPSCVTTQYFVDDGTVSTRGFCSVEILLFVQSIYLESIFVKIVLWIKLNS